MCIAFSFAPKDMDLGPCFKPGKRNPGRRRAHSRRDLGRNRLAPTRGPGHSVLDALVGDILAPPLIEERDRHLSSHKGGSEPQIADGRGSPFIW